MERILTAVAGLNESVETLQGAVGPMGKLASRMPGQKKSALSGRSIGSGAWLIPSM